MEPNATRYATGQNGDRIMYQFTGYCAPVTSDITDGATFTWDSNIYRLVGLHNYQKHTEFMVTK
jgi:hypothetical protein